MKVGIVSQWRNQGQATLSRHLRDALDSLGHETFVLARPTRDTHVLPGRIDRDDVWAQPRVEPASQFQIPAEEYLDWARRCGLSACWFNQNYQFGPIEKLRRSGVRTIGYFVWESFERGDVAKARAAYDVVYSLNRATQARYARLGLESPLVRWGCHPELLAAVERKREGATAFFFPGGLQGPRKPLRAVVEAFRRTKRDDLRLVLKAQTSTPDTEEVDAGGDPRIERIVDDLSTADYLALFRSCHVCLAPSRWEGTGLHFFEAAAFGMSVITNDYPPMNELVIAGENGRLVRSHVVGATKTGVPSLDPDIDDLAAAILELAAPAVRARLEEGQRRRRDALQWSATVADVAALLG